MKRPAFQWLVCPLLGLSVLAAADEPRSMVTDAPDMLLPPGFVAERLYVVPQESQGSWVCLTQAGDGRLITSDQYGKLYRVLVSDTATEPVQVIPLDVEIGSAQGLLYTGDSLFVMVNEPGKSGIYRVNHVDDDPAAISVDKLVAIDGDGEHGPHAVVLSPDHKWLYFCAGNHTRLPTLANSMVPQNWDEDFLLYRLWDPRGHATGIMAPGGWVCRTDLSGQQCELIACGFRNQYDLAFNGDGELFTFDADMEWDLGTPWYRPTRILHVIGGADFGWRGGTAKWPSYFPDTLPSVVDVGPGSPTGVVFGSATSFPADYQTALFAADWSYGRIFAVNIEPRGASYVGEAKVFATAPALPVTDLAVGTDGALYFTTGGRRIQSATLPHPLCGTGSECR